MSKKLTKLIHINQHNIRKNKKEGTRLPVITVKTYKTNDYGHHVEIHGNSEIIYRPEKPLSCGARVWIKTTDPVTVYNEEQETYITI
jgi:hypothetical protein